MESMNFNCRKCKEVTKHLIRIVDDRLPDYVKALECIKCSKFTINLMKKE
jgi:hypothetical protein